MLSWGHSKRDKIVNDFLENNRWKVLRFFGKDIKNNISECITLIEKTLNNNLLR
jgi:DNA mismatch endonuclease (patch repair protein)